MKPQVIGVKFTCDTTEAEEAIARVNRLIGETLDKIEVARAKLAELADGPCRSCHGTGTVPATGRGSDGYERCEDCTP